MLTMVASGAIPLNVDPSESGSAPMIPATRVPWPSQSSVPSRVVHVIAAGNEMGEQPMACHAGIDDGDSLPGSAGELPGLL